MGVMSCRCGDLAGNELIAGEVRSDMTGELRHEGKDRITIKNWLWSLQ